MASWWRKDVGHREVVADRWEGGWKCGGEEHGRRCQGHPLRIIVARPFSSIMMSFSTSFALARLEIVFFYY